MSKFDYDFNEMMREAVPLTDYESLESEYPAYLFWSYILENSHNSENEQELKITDVNLCRPLGGLAVGLLHSLKKHLGIVNPADCIAFTGSMVTSFGIGYNILGPLLLGNKALILEHPISNYETLEEALSLAKVTTLLIDTTTFLE